MGQEYCYYMSYDDERDDFWAMVELFVFTNNPVFEIGSTDEMCELIEKGIMVHIDDIAGLTKYLQDQGFINKEDKIVHTRIQY